MRRARTNGSSDSSKPSGGLALAVATADAEDPVLADGSWNVADDGLASITLGDGIARTGSGRGPQAAIVAPSRTTHIRAATTSCGAESQTGSPLTAATAFSAVCTTTSTSAAPVNTRAVADAPRRQASTAAP